MLSYLNRYNCTKSLLFSVIAFLLGIREATAQQLRRNVRQWQIQREAAEKWLTSQSFGEGSKMSIASYEAPPNNDLFDVCFIYDQAVATFAFLAQGNILKAKMVLNQLMEWQQPSGSFYTAHWCRSGGIWEYNQHVGPTVWVAMAALKYQQITGDATFYRMGDNAVRWSLQWQQVDGGINGGIDWDNQPLFWSSTEHNEDAYAVLDQYGYHSEATLVKSFLSTQMWIPSEGRFMTGRNDPMNVMDVNPWGVLSLGSAYSAALEYAESTHRVYSACSGVDGFDFDALQQDVDDIWFEGTAFMVAAYKKIGKLQEADYILAEIVKKQENTGGIPYSCNGSFNQYWEMSTLNSVSSTGWFIIAAAGMNPFDLS